MSFAPHHHGRLEQRSQVIGERRRPLRGLEHDVPALPVRPHAAVPVLLQYRPQLVHADTPVPADVHPAQEDRVPRHP
jgi:hypothetical protein